MAEKNSTHETNSRTWLQSLEYRYRPLQKGEIRLIRMRHQETDDMHIAGHIASYPLNECPSYMALSYCWGKDVPSHLLVMNGQRIILQDNLDSFLRRVIRYKKREVDFLWIDAICINQADNEEKNTQLALMRDIYASASRIVIWLGEYGGNNHMALEFWKCVAEELRNDDQFDLGLRISKGEIMALDCLRQREYWRRVWILQEASTTTVPREIWCGSRCVAFEAAVLANGALQRYLVSQGHFPQVDPWIPELGNLAAFERLRSGNNDDKHAGLPFQTSDGQKNSLPDLLYKTRDLQASNPRDKIYALLPIYSDIYRGQLPQVDYAKPVSYAFEEAVIHILSREQDPRVFLLCSQSGPLASNSSWIPNFKDIPQYFVAFDCHTKFRARANMALNLSIDLGHRKYVTFHGTWFGTVREVHQPLTTISNKASSTSKAFWQERFSSWINSVAQFFFSNGADQAYARGGLLSEAVDRLLALDCCPGLIMGRTGQVLHWPLQEIMAGASPPRLEDTQPSFTDMLLRIGHASLFWTTSELIGLGDPSVRAGDLVVVCWGLSVPLILRSSALFYRLLGPCFVQGVMDGEALEQGVHKDFLLY